MKFKKIIAGTVLAAALASSANAAVITGQINLTALPGTTVAVNFTTDTVSFLSADFLNTQVDAVTGNMAALAPVGTAVAYDNFAYDPLVAVNPLWTTLGGELAFYITSIGTVSELGGPAPGSPQALTLFGTGTLTSTIPGYESTPATWSFGANRASGATEFSFGSTAAALPVNVPDGGASVALLGVSLLGLAGVRRKFFQK